MGAWWARGDSLFYHLATTMPLPTHESDHNIITELHRTSYPLPHGCRPCTSTRGLDVYSPEKAPMCCVMPPASDAATAVCLRLSSRVVLPWSTCPITATTGGRGLMRGGGEDAGKGGLATSRHHYPLTIQQGQG